MEVGIVKRETLAVSVIILLNDLNKFWEDTIDSVKNQNHQLLEIIVIDGSDQGQGAEITKDDLAIYYYHQPNRNKAMNINFGIQQAKGSAIAFLDAGDLWAPCKLSSQLNYLEAHADVAIVQGLIQNISATTRYSRPIENSDCTYPFINLGSLTCRRSVFEKVGLFDETLDTGEEIDWFLRAWEKNTVKITLKQISLLHRQSNPQLFADSTKLYQIRLLKAVRKCINRRKEAAGKFIETSRNPTNLHKYIGEPREELDTNFEPFTIICDDCWSHGPYLDCGVEYNTPFIGIRIEPPCYLELLKDLQGYVESPLSFITRSKYDYINSWRENCRLDFPIAILKNKVELLFVHELNEEISREKWQRRLERINWNNLFIKFREAPWVFQPEYLLGFHQLQYEYKICFTMQERPEFDWAVSVPEYFTAIASGGNIYEATKKYFDIGNWVRKSYGPNPSAYKIKQGERHYSQ